MEAPKPRAKQKAPERDVMDDVREWAKLRGITLWRNNVGALEWKPGRWLRYGLCNGSSDFIGVRTLTITTSMVGQRIGQLVAIECKAPNGALTEEQMQFIERVRDCGGVAGVARGIDDCEKLISP